MVLGVGHFALEPHFAEERAVGERVEVCLAEGAELPQDLALGRMVEDFRQEPSELVSPQQFARLEGAERDIVIIHVFRRAEVGGVA